jgi:cytidine deaminase
MIKASAKPDIKRLGVNSATAKIIERLFKESLKARKASYSPYSKFAVGAALSLSKQKSLIPFSGCNIENSSYGATVCAERVAIWKAVSENPKAKVQVLVVVTDTKPAAAPCGICRQVLQEFSNAETILCQASLDGVERIFSVAEILPGPFDSSQLP